jgi:uncharacterized protein YceK
MKPIGRLVVLKQLMVCSFAIFSVAGCGTFAGHLNSPSNIPNPIAGAKYYRGVKWDIWLLKDGILNPCATDESQGIEQLCAPIYVADLPVSCAADTLLIPLDAHVDPATNEPPDIPQKDLPWYLR